MVRATIPHTMPTRKDVVVPSEIRKDAPIPIVVKTRDVITIVLVEGKATRRIRL